MSKGQHTGSSLRQRMERDFIRDSQIHHNGQLVLDDGSLTMLPFSSINIDEAKAMFQGSFYDLPKTSSNIGRNRTIERAFYRLARTRTFNPSYKDINSMEDALLMLKPKPVFMFLCVLNTSLSVQCRIRPIENNITSFTKYLVTLAVTAKLIADEVEYTDQNEALLSAFMQDVGYLFYFSLMQNPDRKVITKSANYIKYSTGILNEFEAPFIYAIIMRNLRKEMPPSKDFKLSSIIHLAFFIINSLGVTPDLRSHEKIFDYGILAEKNLGLDCDSMVRKLIIKERVEEVYKALDCIMR